MAYTEIKKKDEKMYYYRVRTMREGKKFRKKRIYLGKNLSKDELLTKEKKADVVLNNKKTSDTLKELIPVIKEILKKNGIKKAGIFGSYAKNKQKKNSDIDIIIEPPKGIGFGFVGIQFDLEEGTKRKIDLVTYKYLNPYLKDKILKEEIRIL